MRIIGFRAKFNGIYEWGVGWLSEEKRDAWRSFFQYMKDSLWSYHTSGDSEYLVTTGGSIYLHPMGVELVLRSDIMSYMYENGRRIETFPAIDSLKNILSGVADSCGGSVEFSETAIWNVPWPEFSGERE